MVLTLFSLLKTINARQYWQIRMSHHGSSKMTTYTSWSGHPVLIERVTLIWLYALVTRQSRDQGEGEEETSNLNGNGAGYLVASVRCLHGHSLGVCSRALWVVNLKVTPLSNSFWVICCAITEVENIEEIYFCTNIKISLDTILFQICFLQNNLLILI